MLIELRFIKFSLISTYGYETARERTRIRPETVGRHRRQAQRSVRLNTTSVAGLRDEGGLPTFSVRQQELGGKANLDGPDVSLPRSMKTVTGPNWRSGRLSSGLQRPRYHG